MSNEEDDTPTVYGIYLEKDHVRVSIVPDTPDDEVAEARAQILALQGVVGVRIRDTGHMSHFEVLPTTDSSLEVLGMKLAELFDIPPATRVQFIIHPTLKGRTNLTCVVILFEEPHSAFEGVAKLLEEFYGELIGPTTIEHRNERCIALTVAQGDSPHYQYYLHEGVRCAQLESAETTQTDYVPLAFIRDLLEARYPSK